ncbi:MAG: MCE family protein [Prevotella sp.]|nr:MCE family protein [Prevotella sp.]
MKLTNEVKIALVAITGIVLMYFGLQYLKGLTLFTTDDHYYARFDNVTGMSASSPIYANGYKVGVVEKVDYDYANQGNIIATIAVDPRLRLPRGTRAEISSDLLGNVQLQLKLGDNPIDLLSKGDTIVGAIQQGMMGKVGDMVPQIEKMLPKLDSILASVNALLASPAIANSLQNVETITMNLNSTTRQLNQLSATLNGQLPQLLTKADGVLTNTEGFTRQLNSIDVANTMNKVNQTLTNVQQMTDALNSKEGTLGLLMHDPQLYNNLNATMSDADKLMIDFREHPKRYIHFSVFGKKDK